ncbi:MAG: small subunit ribosomal protein S16, partial [Myxococcota bacterium]
ADSRFPRDGRHLEVLGHYNPMTQPHTVKLELERVDYWLSVGAQPSDTVAALIKKYRVAGEPEAGDAKAVVAAAEATA